ncbi:MAG: ComF family protein [Oscillospiraceae bacterium]|nr:ComF family protein [Oscillospiraceae bacterium]
MRVLSALLDLLYPPKCPFCGRVLERGEEGWCALCQEELPWTGEGEGRAVELCDGCLSPLWYKAGARAGVHRLKFRGGAVHARLFGRLMAQCLQDRWAQPVDQITWVPLRPSSRARRGYDQAELLARRVGELTGLPVAAALEKCRDTGVQSQLREESARRANVQGAYRALPGAELAGKRLVLVDDVVTSGATLSECAAALRVAGAESVSALTLARAR